MGRKKNNDSDQAKWISGLRDSRKSWQAEEQTKGSWAEWRYMGCTEHRAEAKKRIWMLHSEGFALKAQGKEAIIPGHRARITNRRHISSLLNKPYEVREHRIGHIRRLRKSKHTKEQ
jgi:hypothetical protein